MHKSCQLELLEGEILDPAGVIWQYQGIFAIGYVTYFNGSVVSTWNYNIAQRNSEAASLILLALSWHSVRPVCAACND